MNYNRWMPVQCSSELYHHGVKGMKWGRHLFGKGADVQAGTGGGGGGNEEEIDMQYSFWAPSRSGELYHYGVIGMKWGVHKARKLATLGGSDNPIVAKRNQEKYHDQIAKINSKATRKLERLDRKYQKKQAKADKYFAKGERKANSLFGSKRAADKAFRKASKLQFKANKVANKGARWYEQMKKSYKKGGIPMSKANMDRGEEFIRQVRANSRAMYAASYAGG